MASEPIPLDLDSAMGWLRTGAASLTLEEWLVAPAAARAVLEEAGRRIAAEHAWLVATACRSPEDAAAVLAIADGGRSLRHMQLHQAAREASAAHRSQAAPKATGRVVASWEGE